MKALILAAGLGSRLENETHALPKALVNVQDKPIIYYQLMALKNAGISKLIIVIGYKGSLIKKYVDEYHNYFDVEYIINDKYDESNSSYSFWLAKDSLLDVSYIHLNCDVLFSNKLLEDIILSNYSNVIAVRNDYNLHDGMENVVIANNQILDMSLINTDKSNGKAFGLAKFSSDSTNYLIDKLKNYIIADDLNQNYYGMIRLAVKEKLYNCIVSDRMNLMEINTLDDLEYVDHLLPTSKIH